MLPTLAQRLAIRSAPSGLPVMRQRWSRLLFAHWAVSPSEVQATLPPGLHVDTFNGEAFVGIVPFFMERIRPVCAPPLPWLSWFLELNVRTYVYDEAGNAGVWFYSLDCNQPVAVRLARRFFHLPYHHATMKAAGSKAGISYRCQRDGEPLASSYDYQARGQLVEAEPGTLEFFLVERYLLFSQSPDGRLNTGRVYHAPYRVCEAACAFPGTEPLRQAGFSVPQASPRSLLYSPGVDVKVYPLKRVLQAYQVPTTSLPLR